ncbi:hypothetical protein AB0R12_30735 [Streptomyces niveus]
MHGLVGDRRGPRILFAAGASSIAMLKVTRRDASLVMTLLKPENSVPF